MSADGWGGCPNCVSLELGKPISEVTIKDLNAARSDEGCREYHNLYIDKGQYIVNIDGVCDDCEYRYSINATIPIPEV